MNLDCYCDEVINKPCPSCILKRDYFNDSWNSLNDSEKLFCVNYKRLLLNDRPISNDMILKINKIMEKYPDFTVVNIP
jgi:hypothetical protein